MTDNEQGQAIERKLKADADIKDYYFSTFAQDKRHLFKKTAIKLKNKAVYDEIQEIKVILLDFKQDYQSYMLNLNRFTFLSKELIVKVAIELI